MLVMGTRSHYTQLDMWFELRVNTVLDVRTRQVINFRGKVLLDLSHYKVNPM